MIPLVFGAFGEVNDGVEELIKQLAELGAVIHWRRMKAREPEEAVGALSWMLRRRWGITVRCLDCSGHLPGTAPYVAISSVLKTLVGTTDLVPFPMLPPIGPGLPDQ